MPSAVLPKIATRYVSTDSINKCKRPAVVCLTCYFDLLLQLVDGTKDPERYYTSASRAITRPDVRFSRNCVLGALFGGHFTNADGGDIHVARLNYPVRLFWIISSFCGRDACTSMVSITFYLERS